MPAPAIKVLGVYRILVTDELFTQAMQWKYAAIELTPEEREATERAATLLRGESRGYQ